MKEETERQLLSYLQEQKEADMAGTLKSIVDWTQRHEHADDLRHSEIKGELRGHSLRIGTLEKNDDKIDDKLEKSGSWQLEAEQAKLVEASKEANWWKDKAITVIVGLVMLLVGGAAHMLFGGK